MSKKPRCELGKTIEKRLIDINQDQKWLINSVRNDTGMFFDGSYLHKILTGKLKTPTIVSSICKILDIKNLC